MANVTEVKNQVAKTKNTDIATLIKQSAAELGKALPSHMNPERLVRIALTTLRLNPELYKCTPESFLGALFQSAQLGLEPNIEGQAYILPFNNKRKINGEWVTLKEAQFLIGYKGYAELFYRHQSSVSLQMDKVCQNDEFDYALGTDNFLKHKPALKDRGEVIGYYAIAKMKNGACVFKFMPKTECMEHGQKYSKCYSKTDNKFFEYTPWNTNPDAMCMKTVLTQLMKLLPKSVEIQRAVSMDETIKTKIDKDMFAVPDNTNWEAEEAQVVEEPKETEAMQARAAEIADAYHQCKTKKELEDAHKTYEKEVIAMSKALQQWLDDEYNSNKKDLK